MAKQGNFAALQRLQPTQGLSQDIQYWNNDARQRRQERRVEDNIEYEREQARKREQAELYDKYVKPGKAYDTGSDSLNEVIARGLSEAREQYLPNLKILEDPNASREDQIKARLRLDNLNKLPEHYQLVTQKYTAEWNAYKEARQSGSAWENPELEKSFQNGFKTFELGLDDQMQPTVAFVDKDGDGENDLLGVQTFDQIKQGMPLFDWQKKYNMGSMAQGVAEIVGEIDTTELTDNGFGKSRVKQAKLEGLRMNAKKLLYDKEGNPSDVAKSFMKETGIKDLNKLEEEFVNLSKTYTNELREENLDQGAINSNRRENRLSSQNENPIKITEPVKPSEEVWGGSYLSIADGARSVGVDGVKLDAVRDGDKVITDATVKNVTYDNNGNMLVDVAYQDVKNSTFKAKEESILEQLVKAREAKDATNNPAQQEKFEEEIKKYNLQLDRLSTGAQNKRKVVKIPKEDEAAVANSLGGIDSIRQRVFPEGEPKKQEVDEYGVPIN